MKRINMTKYGFERWPEQDFSDDGARFTCYKAGTRVRVSKTIYRDTVFIDARIDSGNLPWELYSKLPHYSVLSKLNGVTIAVLTEADLQELYDNCLAYEAEYIDAENNLVFPTAEEIIEQCTRIRVHYQEQLNELAKMFNNNAVNLLLKLSGYDIKTLQSYFSIISERANGYDANKYVVNKDSAWGLQFVKPTNNDLVEHWYFDEICRIIKKVGY